MSSLDLMKLSKVRKEGDRFKSTNHNYIKGKSCMALGIDQRQCYNY